MKIALTNLILCSFLSFVLAQTTVTLEPIMDNTLIENATGSLSNGGGPEMFAGRLGNNGGGIIQRAVLKFNVASAIPPGATITAVSLQLNMSKTNSGSQTVLLKKMTADWGEGSSSNSTGQGAPSTSNDATWLHRFYNASTWATQGGDFSATTSASTAVDAVGLYTWGSNAQMIADVQSWRTSPSSNFGWILIGGESTPLTIKRFDTRETTTAANRPHLAIVYTTAVPVELLSFTAKPSGSAAVQLNWATASEYDSRDFAVEYRSNTEGGDFQTVEILKAAGQSSEKRLYQLKHTPPKQNGIHYYRLRQTDFDGKENLSAVVSVVLGKEQALNIYPNPVKTTLFVDNLDAFETVSIFDVLGKQVRAAVVQNNSIDVSDLQNGVYFLKTTTGRLQQFLKF